MTAVVKAFPATPMDEARKRAERNSDLIMRAAGTVVMVDGGHEACRFHGADKTPQAVKHWLTAHPNAVAMLGGVMLIGFEQKPDPVAALQATSDPLPPALEQAIAEVTAKEVEVNLEKEQPPKVPPRSAPPKPPNVPLKKPIKPAARVVPATSLNEFIGPTGHLTWPDVKKTADGGFVPKSTCANARVAILALEIECKYNECRNRLLVGGHQIGQWAGELSDHACQMLRVLIQRHFGFDPGNEHINDAAVQLCLENTFNPVVEYLDGLQWDRKSRLDTWLIDYLGAEDTELIRAIGRLVLVAAVRRARQPGIKFDQILVLEGPEGTQKSTAISVLAGPPENFSDQTILGVDEKRQMEQVEGRWLYEIAELAGMQRSEVEKVKSFASRTVDRGRRAYGRYNVDQPRRCIFIATTNDDSYLKSQTGNRRFWPVKTGKIAINALRRDRDQLWAEAATAEAAGEAIQLPERLWSHAAAEQNKRLEHDPWDDILDEVRGCLHREFDGYEERVASRTLIADYLKIPPERQTKEVERKLAQCMRRLGWSGPRKMRIAETASGLAVPQRGYFRAASDEQSMQ